MKYSVVFVLAVFPHQQDSYPSLTSEEGHQTLSSGRGLCFLGRKQEWPAQKPVPSIGFFPRALTSCGAYARQDLGLGAGRGRRGKGRALEVYLLPAALLSVLLFPLPGNTQLSPVHPTPPRIILQN